MKLEVAIEDKSQCIKDVTIEVPAGEVQVEFDKAYETFQRHVKLPGFRPGRVPRELVKQRFGREVKEQVAKHLLPHALEHALSNNGLFIVSKPTIHQDYSITEGQALKFKASIEVWPEFELKEYKGLKVTKSVTLVSDDDVEKTLQSWRESAAELVTIEDRPSQIGDLISANLIGKYIEPEGREDIKANDVQIELGASGVHEAFNENLTGVKAGDVREFRVVYPADFSSEGLAGKTLDFTATVLAVRRKEMPELDDDFAKQFGEGETIEHLREMIRKELANDRERKADYNVRVDLMQQLLESHDFDAPPSLVEQKAIESAREFAYWLAQSGLSPQKIKEWDWAGHMEKERKQAVGSVRATLIASKISEIENTTVSRAEIDAEIARMADSTGEPFAQLKARLTKEDTLSSIENRLLYQKALDLIVNNAEITLREITPNQEAEKMKAGAAVET